MDSGISTDMKCDLSLSNSILKAKLLEADDEPPILIEIVQEVQ